MVEPSGHCPYLGLKQNQAIRFASPTPEHRCYASGQAQEIPTIQPDYQASYCLSAGHVKCPLYTGMGLPSTPAPAPVPARPVAAAGGLGGWLGGLAPLDRAIYGVLLALLGVILAVYAVAGFGLFNGSNLFGNGPGPLAPAATTTPGASFTPATASPSASASPSATRTGTATASPSASASPSATRTGTATASPSATATATVFIYIPPPPPPPPPPPTNTPSDLVPIPSDTPAPTLEPSSTSAPTAEPSPEPTVSEPSPEPTAEPAPAPTAEPAPAPTAATPPEGRRTPDPAPPPDE